MEKKIKTAMLISVILAACLLISWTAANRTIFGTWRLVKKESTSLAAWGTIDLNIKMVNGKVSVKKIYSRGKGCYTDEYAVAPGRAEVTVTVGNKNWSKERIMEINWPENRFMGVRIKDGTEKKIKAEWKQRSRKLVVTSSMDLLISQGTVNVETVSEFAISSNGKTLTLTEKRSTRDAPITYVFERVK